VPAGALYVVATPIGNLEDITLRALRVLKEVTVIACEDTRVTRKLLAAHEIRTPVLSYHAHSKPQVVDRILERIESGEDVALVTDAGTPLVSDPGDTLVKMAIARGIRVAPIPGPSALLATLVASGLPSEAVLFLGFLPRPDSERREVLAPLRDAPYTIVLYESPKRVRETLEMLERTLGDRDLCVGRELTKRFETFERGRLSQLCTKFDESTLGEITIVVGPAFHAEAVKGIEVARKEAERLLAQGMRAADVAKVIAGAHGLARQEAYQLVLEAKKAER
jgi:16S rRNA (cytidine1402-2'-O)-methyltransferase